MLPADRPNARPVAATRASGPPVPERHVCIGPTPQSLPYLLLHLLNRSFVSYLFSLFHAGEFAPFVQFSARRRQAGRASPQHRRGIRSVHPIWLHSDDGDLRSRCNQARPARLLASSSPWPATTPRCPRLAPSALLRRAPPSPYAGTALLLVLWLHPRGADAEAGTSQFFDTINQSKSWNRSWFLLQPTSELEPQLVFATTASHFCYNRRSGKLQPMRRKASTSGDRCWNQPLPQQKATSGIA